MLTAFVALTELPQHGQIYFRVLDVRGGVVLSVPLCVPVPVMRKPVNSLRFMLVLYFSISNFS